MKGYTFSEIVAMSDSEREQLRKQVHEEKPSTLDADAIGKAFQEAGGQYADGVVATMKCHEATYREYRQVCFKRVNS